MEKPLNEDALNWALIRLVEVEQSALRTGARTAEATDMGGGCRKEKGLFGQLSAVPCYVIQFRAQPACIASQLREIFVRISSWTR